MYAIRSARLPAPGLYDATDVPGADTWFPANDVTALLVVCLEACKDITRHAQALAEKTPTADRRGMTLLSTPILSLVENTVRLHKLLGREDRSHWPPKDIEKFRLHAKHLRKHEQGGLRKLRSTRAAHHDSKMLGEGSGVPEPKPEVILLPLTDALLILILCLNHEQVFHWTRYPDPAKRDEIELFVETVATKARADADGYIKEILEITLARDPRHHAMAAIEETIAAHNRLVADAGYPRRQITLTRL